jgi:hypothetical protein
MPGIKKKVKVKKIPEGPRRKDLGATFRPGRIRSDTTGRRIRKAGGAVKKADGGSVLMKKAINSPQMKALKKKLKSKKIGKKAGGTVKRMGGGMAKSKKY